MHSTGEPEPQHTPAAPVIGADVRTTEHQQPAPTPAEHVAAFRAARPGDCIGAH